MLFFEASPFNINSRWLAFIIIRSQKKKFFLGTLKKKIFEAANKKTEGFCFSNFTKVAGIFFSVEKRLVLLSPNQLLRLQTF